GSGLRAAPARPGARAGRAGGAHRRDAPAVVPVHSLLALPAERSDAPGLGAAPAGPAAGRREGSQGRPLVATHKIALLGGDGIGQEVTPEARRVLEVVGKATGASFEFETALIGGAAIDATGEPLPPSTL